MNFESNEEIQTDNVTEIPSAVEPETGSETHVDNLEKAIEELRKAEAEQLNEVVTEFLSLTDEKFESGVQTSNLPDIVLLMEGLSKQPDIKTIQSKVRFVKKQYDHLTSVRPKEEEKDEHQQFVSRFHTAYSAFSKKKSEFDKQQEEERQKNTDEKKELLEKLKDLIMDVNSIDQVRAIQEKWKNLGQVISSESDNINKTYKAYIDSFYKLREQNHELIELDRKHNLEEKQKLITELRSLIPEGEDLKDGKFWKDASEKVKSLHETWKTIGQVAKEKSDEIWNEFKTATDAFYNIRRKYYESQDSIRALNAERKHKLIEDLSKFENFTSEDIEEWKSVTESIRNIQIEWTKIGQAPSEINNHLWKRFREASLAFYNNKTAFFKKIDAERDENLKRKLEICEAAEALSESTDWKTAGEELKKLQNEWKEIGKTNPKDSNKVWKRFRKACDSFFSRRDQFEQDNLALKVALCEKVESFLHESDDANHVDDIKQLQKDWQQIGIVPIKEKEKIWNRFRKACNQYFDNLKKYRKPRDYDDNRGKRDERGLFGKVKKLEEKILQYETNIMYIAKGKSGDVLRANILGKIEEAKAEKADLEKKIKEMKAAGENPESVKD